MRIDRRKGKDIEMTVSIVSITKKTPKLPMFLEIEALTFVIDL